MEIFFGRISGYVLEMVWYGRNASGGQRPVDIPVQQSTVSEQLPCFSIVSWSIFDEMGTGKTFYSVWAEH